MGIGSLLYGVDADIRSESQNHFEDIRRLAEVSHILLDAGMILILSAAELTQEDLEIIHTGVGREQVVTVWVGPGEDTDIKPQLRFQDESIERIVTFIQSRL